MNESEMNRFKMNELMNELLLEDSEEADYHRSEMLDRIREIIDRTQKTIRQNREERYSTHSQHQLGAAEERLRIVVRDLKELIEQ